MKELAGKRPATVVRQSPLPPARVRQPTTLVGDKQRVLQELKVRQSRHEIESAGPLRLITEGRYAGRFGVDVILLDPVKKQPVPRWTKVLIATGSTLIGLSALFGTVAWLLSSLSPVALVAVCLTVVACLVAWCKAKYGRRGGRVVITQTVMMDR